jgi:hypothetical protein
LGNRISSPLRETVLAPGDSLGHTYEFPISQAGRYTIQANIFGPQLATQPVVIDVR